MSKLIGRKVKDVRPATEAEAQELGWDEGYPVIVLDNDTRLYASCDEEGNAPGALFVDNADGSAGMVAFL